MSRSTGASASEVTEEQVLAAMAPFRGEIMQVPSSVSAIKVDGERAYKRVRGGEAVELAARPVTVSRYEATGFDAGSTNTSTSRSRCSARPAPTCARSPAISAANWASEGT